MGEHLIFRGDNDDIKCPLHFALVEIWWCKQVTGNTLYIVYEQTSVYSYSLVLYAHANFIAYQLTESALGPKTFLTRYPWHQRLLNSHVNTFYNKWGGKYHKIEFIKYGATYEWLLFSFILFDHMQIQTKYISQS